MDARFTKRVAYFLAISGIVLFLASLLQTSFLPMLEPFGAIPDLVLILVCGVAFYLGPVDGALFGLVAGLLIDALGGGGLFLSPVFYVAIGVFGGVLSSNSFANKFIHWCIYSVLFCLAKAIYSMFIILLSAGEIRLGAAIVSSVVPELVGTFLLSLALVYPVRLLAGLLRGRMNTKKGKGGLGGR